MTRGKVEPAEQPRKLKKPDLCIVIHWLETRRSRLGRIINACLYLYVLPGSETYQVLLQE